jgi:hypothetical protein
MPHAGWPRSSAIYFSRWGNHHIKESLYRKVGVRNGPTIKPIVARRCHQARWNPRDAQPGALRSLDAGLGVSIRDPGVSSTSGSLTRGLLR